MTQRIRTGDIVRHIENSETWVVAYADNDRRELAPCGFPDCTVSFDDVDFDNAATDEEFLQLYNELLATKDRRGRKAKEFHGEEAEDIRKWLTRDVIGVVVDEFGRDLAITPAILRDSGAKLSCAIDGDGEHIRMLSEAFDRAHPSDCDAIGRSTEVRLMTERFQAAVEASEDLRRNGTFAIDLSTRGGAAVIAPGENPITVEQLTALARANLDARGVTRTAVTVLEEYSRLRDQQIASKSERFCLASRDMTGEFILLPASYRSAWDEWQDDDDGGMDLPGYAKLVDPDRLEFSMPIEVPSKERICLVCDLSFISEGAHNRVCSDCRDTHAMKKGAL